MQEFEGRQWGQLGPDVLMTMSGIDLLKAMSAGELPGPTIGRTMNFGLAEVGEGHAVFVGETNDQIINPLGFVHGGWVLTLIDSAAGCACHTLLPAGVGYTTVETKVNMVRALRADSGRVRCEGRVIHAGRSIMTADAKVTGPDGRLLAHGTSTIMVLGRGQGS